MVGKQQVHIVYPKQIGTPWLYTLIATNNNILSTYLPLCTYFLVVFNLHGQVYYTCDTCVVFLGVLHVF